MIAIGLILFVLGMLGRAVIQPDLVEFIHELRDQEARKKRERYAIVVAVLILVGAVLLLLGISSWLWKYAP